MADDKAEYRFGLVLGLACYLVWGLVPLFFKLLKEVPAGEVVANRILWSAVILLLIAVPRGRLPAIGQIFRDPKLLTMLCASATFIAINWLVYIWAVNANHLLAASLGYFLNPLVNVALGIVVLGERLRRLQIVAVAIAAVGVVIAALGALSELWISVALALSFGFYGLVRKQAQVSAVEGLTVETLILAPVFLLGLVWQAQSHPLAFGRGFTLSALLVASAFVTSVPLVVFAMAAKRLPFATIGLLQYIAPSMVFLIATLGYHEAMRPQLLIAFVFIWVALALFTIDLLRDVMALRATA